MPISGVPGHTGGVQDFTGSQPSYAAAAAIVAFVLVTAACGGGARPTLTGDRLVERASPVATVEPAIAAATPVPAASAPSEGTAASRDTQPDLQPATGEIKQFVVEVIEQFPHDAAAFTQGLELHDGFFIESTGRYGESDIRRVVPATGQVVQSASVPEQFFAEGLTKVGDVLIQLTWRENTALFYDATSFEVIKEVNYSGEGWGLCYDGSRLVMTDGTPALIFRDVTTFEETSRVTVTLNGQEVWNLNETECVNGQVWANIWQTDLIVRIDPASGVVTGVVDAASLVGPDDNSDAVLNGIAWDATTQSFYVTGKLWPTMYRVNFVPAPTN